MKTLILTTLLAVGSLSAQASGHYYHPYRSHSSFSFSFGYPYAYSSWYRPALTYYAPAPYVYSYSPGYYGSSYGYGGYGYGDYSRPNYAVGGTLLGAGIGAIIGNNVHHQTWQGAAIGAASGLLLGGLLEHNTRSHERSYVAPPVSYAQPNYIPPINDAPRVPDAPTIPSRTPAYQPASSSSMSGANSLFGR